MTEASTSFPGLVETFPGNLASFARESLQHSDEGAQLVIDATEGGRRPYRSGAFASVRSFSHGRFEAEIRAAPGSGLVTGFFLHRDTPRQEIDIEFAHWGDPLSPIDNYTVYPAQVGTRPTTRSFPFRLSGVGNSTHTLTWTSTSVLFQSFRGSNVNPSVSWLFQPRDPQSRIPQIPLPVHINLWLFQGQAPLNGQDVEVIIRAFTFTPM